MTRLFMRALCMLVPGLLTSGCYFFTPGEVTEEFTLHSDIVGDDYTISLFEPPGTDPSQPLPVVFILDADTAFGTASSWYAEQLEAGKLRPVLLVGVGYGSIAENGRDRRRDYVLPSQDEPRADVEAFYRFLETELFPALERRRSVSAEPTDHYLLGHSYGGFAAMYGLFRHPDFIRNIGAASASINYDRYRILELEAEWAAQHTDLPGAVYLSSGTQDAGGEPALAQGLRRRLESRGWPSLRLHSELHEGKTHQGSLPASLHGAMRFLLSPEGTP